jgi:hypothetical protein
MPVYFKKNHLRFDLLKLNPFKLLKLFLVFIWNERNNRVFNNKSSVVTQVASCISVEFQQWIAAGYRALSTLL